MSERDQFKPLFQYGRQPVCNTPEYILGSHVLLRYNIL